MTDNIENLILEHLKALRNELRDFKAQATSDLNLIKLRLPSLESQRASIHSDMAPMHGCIDLVDTRLDRIERRLELREDV